LAKQQDFVLKERARKMVQIESLEDQRASQLDATGAQKQDANAHCRYNRDDENGEDQDCAADDINRRRDRQGADNQFNATTSRPTSRAGNFRLSKQRDTAGAIWRLDLGTGGLSQGIQSQFAFRLDAAGWVEEQIGLVGRGEFQSGSTRLAALWHPKVACCRLQNNDPYSESYSSE
jgi:hypothetical protein